MQKQKQKFSFKKTLITVLLGIILVNGASVLLQKPAFAADFTASADGLTMTYELQAGETADEIACPDTHPTKTVNENKIICEKGATDDFNKLSAELQGSVSFLIGIEKLLGHLIWPVLTMIGGLLDNNILFGNGMEERLHAVWVPIRNILNIFFVIILLIVALYNIIGVGGEDDTYSLKKMLPKVLIAIIAVNFSFLMMKVILDGVKVLTDAVFALPNQVSQSLGDVIEKDPVLMQKFCTRINNNQIASSTVVTGDALKEEVETQIYRDVASESGIAMSPNSTIAQIQQALSATSEDKQTAFNKKVQERINGRLCDGNQLSEEGRKFLNTYGSRNAALALALNMGKIVFYDEVPPVVVNIDKLFVNSFFSVILYLIYVISFLALFIVLIVRLVVLWLAIVFSPVLVTAMVIPEIKEKLSFMGSLMDEFVKNAIAPIGIGFAMSVGWIMLSSLQSVNKFDVNAAIFMEGGLPVTGLRTLQDLIVCLGTLAVVWLGVFAAASETIAKGVTDSMKEFVGKSAKWLGKLPLRYTPLSLGKIQGEESHISPLGLLQAAKTFGDSMDAHTYEEGRKLAHDMGFGTSPTNPHSFSRNMQSGNKDEIYRAILDNQGELGSKYENDTIRALKQAMKDETFKATVDPKLMTKLEEYEKSHGDMRQAKLKEITDWIRGNTSVQPTQVRSGATGAAATAAAGATAAGAAGAPTPAATTETMTVGGVAVPPNDQAPLRTLVNSQINPILDNSDLSEGDKKTQLEGIIGGLYYPDASGKHTPTATELTALFKEKLPALQTALGVSSPEEAATRIAELANQGAEPETEEPPTDETETQ